LLNHAPISGRSASQIGRGHVASQRNARGRGVDLEQLMAEPVDRRIKQGEEIDQDIGASAKHLRELKMSQSR
jgi:hypothetical protein